MERFPELAMKAKKLIHCLREWSADHPDITGVFLVGSHARCEAEPESDIDIVMLTKNPGEYLNDLKWIKCFGDVESVGREDWGKVQSLRVFYSDGPEVEFGITTSDWAAHPIPETTLNVLREGYRIIYDPVGDLVEAVENHLD